VERLLEGVVAVAFSVADWAARRLPDPVPDRTQEEVDLGYEEMILAEARRIVRLRAEREGGHNAD